MLGKFAAGNASFGFSNEEEATFKVSDWSVTTTLTSPGAREGGAAFGRATLQ